MSPLADRDADVVARRGRADQLGEEIRRLASQLHAGQAELAGKLAEFDAIVGWEGFRSCADWLGLNGAMTSFRSRELVRVGHALEELPLVREAVRTGTISFDAAAELSRVATADDQQLWLQVAASATGPQLARICRASKWVFDIDSREHGEERLRRRGAWTSYGEDGMCTLRAVLCPEEMAIVTSALDRTSRAMDRHQDLAAAASDDEKAAACEVRDPAIERLSARWADALLAICADTKARDMHELAADPSTMPMVVHVDVEALVGDMSNARRDVDGARIPLSVVRKLACDSTVVTILERDGSPLDVGRRHRIVPPKLRLAIQARDTTCRFPGCAVPARRCDADHIVSWIDGGETVRGNIASLCGFHHSRKHQGVFSYRGNADGDLIFELPSGKRVLTPLPVGGDALQLTTAPDVSPSGGAPPHPSGRMHLGYVVAVLTEEAADLRRPPRDLVATVDGEVSALAPQPGHSPPGSTCGLRPLRPAPRSTPPTAAGWSRVVGCWRSARTGIGSRPAPHRRCAADPPRPSR